jgi:hypothetical protein
MLASKLMMMMLQLAAVLQLYSDATAQNDDDASDN